MTQTYAQIQNQIERLQREADALREQEVVGVVARIKEAINHYDLTAEQLGFGGGRSSGRAKSFGKVSSGAKYVDGNGQSWSGRGPRPRWLREAIAGGASLESFLSAPVRGRGVKAAKTLKSKRRPSTVLYQDGAGNSWAGRGPQPRWLKEAIAGGKTLESLKS